MQKSINHKLFFSQAPNDVWDYLTKPELIELWLMKNDFQPILGHQFHFLTTPMPNIGFDGIVYCTVMEIVPFRKLTYTWKGGPGSGKITLDSVVEWTLQPKDGGTELQLVHTGFKEMENVIMYSLMDAGWMKNMLKIVGYLNAQNNDTTEAGRIPGSC